MRLSCLVSLLLSAAACSSRPAPAAPPFVTFTGACDASGAVQLSTHTFALADDEDSVIRVYDAERGGAPLAQHDLSPSLELPEKISKKSGRARPAPETDLEAATRLGSLAFWITSHGRSSSGKAKAERARFFATQLDGVLGLVGRPYHDLLTDLLADPRYAAHGLAEASQRAPKAKGGLNIEGLTARVEGGLLVGFRSPTPGDKALLAPLLDPEAVVHGEQARFGAPILLDLGGRGVRGLSRLGDRYLILAGPHDGAGSPVLYVWSGTDRLRRIEAPELSAFNLEAFFSPDEGAKILLLSDDGTVRIDGTECKQLKESERKRFRGLWLPVAKLGVNAR